MKNNETAIRDAYNRKDKYREQQEIDTTEEIQKYVGKQVSLVRKCFFEWEQEYLAEKANLTKAIISNLERGNTSEFKTLEAVADAFGVPLLLFFPGYNGELKADHDENFHFGNTVSNIQRTKGITCAELAWELALSTQSISAIRAKVEPGNFARMYQIAQALQVGIEEICPQNQGALSATAEEVSEAYLRVKAIREKYKYP